MIDPSIGNIIIPAYLPLVFFTIEDIILSKYINKIKKNIVEIYWTSFSENQFFFKKKGFGEFYPDLKAKILQEYFRFILEHYLIVIPPLYFI